MASFSQRRKENMSQRIPTSRLCGKSLPDTEGQNTLPVRVSSNWATNRQHEKSSKRKQRQNVL
jgi:hypothetical protein